jgi:hypothetical protein
MKVTPYCSVKKIGFKTENPFEREPGFKHRLMENKFVPKGGANQR